MISTGDKVKHGKYGAGIVIWVYRGAALVVRFADGEEREVAEADVMKVSDTDH